MAKMPNDLDLKDIHISHKEKSLLMIFAMCVCVFVIIYGSMQLYQMRKCKDNGGIYLEKKECYYPESESERQRIIEQGYVDSGNHLEDIMNWSYFDEME